MLTKHDERKMPKNLGHIEISMNRHDGEYTALIHKLAQRYGGRVVELLILTDEDMTPHENKVRQELRAAGIQPGKQLELALADVTLAMLRAVGATPRH